MNGFSLKNRSTRNGERRAALIDSATGSTAIAKDIGKTPDRLRHEAMPAVYRAPSDERP
jgi:hypothetical protein